MQKLYLLLRNNQQTGPYSLEEIVKLNLKPFDLVWVEGKSAAWRYPGEIDSLKVYVPTIPQSELPFQPISTEAMDMTLVKQARSSAPFNTPSVPKNVFVSLPDRGQKVSVPFHTEKANEPVREAVFNPEPRSVNKVEEEVRTHYSRTVNDVEEDYSNWVFRQKTRKKSTIGKRQLALGALVIFLSGGIYWLLSDTSATTTGNSIHSDLSAGQIVPPREVIQSGSSEEKNQSLVLPTIGEDQVRVSSKKQAINTPAQTVKKKITPVSHSSSAPVTIPGDEGIKEPERIPDADYESSVPAQTEKGKKKKVREMIRDVFSKKNKKEEVTQNGNESEEPRMPANNRQTARREESTTGNNESIAGIADQLELSSNAPDNWMMGVTGLKLTLRNRSQSTIQKAEVTVLYFNENNQLLEKKSIYFSNVAPGGKTTLPAPDHKFADHTELRLGAVSARNDSYAKH